MYIVNCHLATLFRFCCLSRAAHSKIVGKEEERKCESSPLQKEQETMTCDIKLRRMLLDV
jgi:hypothetical protein